MKQNKRLVIYCIIAVILSGCGAELHPNPSIPVLYKAPGQVDSEGVFVKEDSLSVQTPTKTAVTVQDVAPLSSVQTVAPTPPSKLSLVSVVEQPAPTNLKQTSMDKEEARATISAMLADIAREQKMSGGGEPDEPKIQQFIWPVMGKGLIEYGSEKNGVKHDGLTIAAPLGAPVKASEAGVVAKVVDNMRGLGSVIILQHKGSPWTTIYAHLDSILVDKGEAVSRGQVIGTVGASGGVILPQLLFQVRENNQAVNPRTVLPK